MKLQTAKGVRDIPPEELIRRNALVRKLINIFESFGFNPLETPILERIDVLNVKFGAGQESDVSKEIFMLKDKGERWLGLRYELTLSMCRYVAMNPTIKFPFKRYEIGRVYRDGPIKLGRSREFTQCDVDIVGSSSFLADAECIFLALNVFDSLGLDAYLEVNNRKLLEGILEYAGIPEDKRTLAMISIDKLKKIGVKGVINELENTGIKELSIEKILNLINAFKFEGVSEGISGGRLIEKLTNKLMNLLDNDTSKKALKELSNLFSLFSESQLKRIKFNPFLARGLGYYTGIVFEGYLNNSDLKSSICGGGRYDDLIMKLMNSKQKIPAVGISFGLVPIMESIKMTSSTSTRSVTQVFVIPVGGFIREAFNIASELRKQGIRTEIDLMGRGLSKNFAYMNSYGINFALIIGEDELKKGKYKLKNMTSGEEQFVELKEVKKIVEA